MKYNKREIMRAAWSLYRMSRKWVDKLSFGECLRRAWGKAKAAVKAAAEVAAQGIVRMHYSEYKRDYSNCQTVEGSYDKATKTIEVMTKVRKGAKALLDRVVTGTVTRLCPRCHTYCDGDCSFNRAW